MTVSEKQLTANQANATHSTGPKTAAGKKSASRNATQHGIFSRDLFLVDEKSADFHALLDGLHSTLRPSGVLEETLVERIAVTIWRQRRLVRAESALIDLQMVPKSIASSVSSEMNLSYDNQLDEEDLKPFDKKEAKRFYDMLEEYEALPELVLDGLQDQAPTIYAQLVKDADDEELTVEKYLVEINGIQDYLVDLEKWCHEQTTEAEQRPIIISIAKMVRAKKAFPTEHKQAMLLKHQTTLDNQLFKAIKALRETQTWRLETMEGAVVPDTGSGLSDAV
jgi:hypothetical protein